MTWKLASIALAATLLGAALTGCAGDKSAAEKNSAQKDGVEKRNVHPLSTTTYSQAVTALEQAARDIETPSELDDGRMVGAAKLKGGGALIVTIASKGDDVCLQAKVYGEAGAAYAVGKAGTLVARTDTPAAASCEWFLRNPDVDPSATEIADFGADDVVFDAKVEDTKPWPKDLTALREEMIEIVTQSLEPWLERHGDGRGYELPGFAIDSPRADYSVGFADGKACLRGTLRNGKALWYVTEDDEILRTAEDAAKDAACT